MDDARSGMFKYNVRVDGVDGNMVTHYDQTSIKVDSSYLPNINDPGLFLSHPNYLCTRFINSDQEPSERIYEYFDSSLSDHVAKFGNPIESYSCDLVNYDFLNPKFIEVIRVLITFVIYMHSKNLVFSDKFKLNYDENFGVINGVVKFWKLNLDKNPTKKKKRSDWRRICHIIRRNLLRNLEEAKYPMFLSDLITTLLNDQDVRNTPSNSDSHFFTVKCEDFFLHHFALLTHTQRLAFVKKCVDNRLGLKEDERRYFNEAKSWVHIRSNWIDRLPNAFKYVKHNLQNQCMEKQKEKLKEKLKDSQGQGSRGQGGEGSQGQIEWTDEELCKNVKSLLYVDNVKMHGSYNVFSDILRVCRNMATHLMNSIRVVHPFAKIEDITVDASIMALFDEELLSFQKCLFDRELLEYFM